MILDRSHSGNHVLGDFPPDSVLFGQSEVMQKLKSKLVRVSPTSVPVLLQGEVGVGKSVLSRFIHFHSACAGGSYVSLNCAALSGPASLEDPFLPVQGALGLAGEHCQDASPLSRYGTLFLEQVSELTPRLQRQLERSLTESEERATPDRHEVREKVRIVCSTTRNLRRDVMLGYFRRDLFHRIVVVTIDVPPLRDRLQDLPGIAEYLRIRQSAQLAVTEPPFSPELLARMLTYPWPGNIRELENFVYRYVLLGGEECRPEVRAPSYPLQFRL
jgi:DNA-binding NtrC family response regulator